MIIKGILCQSVLNSSSLTLLLHGLIAKPHPSNSWQRSHTLYQPENFEPPSPVAILINNIYFSPTGILYTPPKSDILILVAKTRHIQIFIDTMATFPNVKRWQRVECKLRGLQGETQFDKHMNTKRLFAEIHCVFLKPVLLPAMLLQYHCQVFTSTERCQFCIVYAILPNVMNWEYTVS